MKREVPIGIAIAVVVVFVVVTVGEWLVNPQTTLVGMTVRHLRALLGLAGRVW